jgi:flagellar basal body rod protein FlgG
VDHSLFGVASFNASTSGYRREDALLDELLIDELGDDTKHVDNYQLKLGRQFVIVGVNPGGIVGELHQHALDDTSALLAVFALSTVFVTTETVDRRDRRRRFVL